ncbi:MAG: cytochrome c oxidase subunit 3 [Bacteroidota bacterium]
MIQSINKPIIDEKEPGVEPKKFVLWLLLVSSVMLFAGFTSAYIVRRGEGEWVVFELPVMFMLSTGVIVLSSVFMQWAYISAKKDEILNSKIGLLVTLTLGLLFGVMQYWGWSQMVYNAIYFGFANPSGSFVYVITGLHVAHVIIGIFYVLAILIQTFQYKVHKKALRAISMCNTYWHFVGILWIYLYVFLLLNR